MSKSKGKLEVIKTKEESILTELTTWIVQQRIRRMPIIIYLMKNSSLNNQSTIVQKITIASFTN
jgi:hypothetical protein